MTSDFSASLMEVVMNTESIATVGEANSSFFHCVELFAAIRIEASPEGFVTFLLDRCDDLTCHLILLVSELCDIL